MCGSLILECVRGKKKSVVGCTRDVLYFDEAQPEEGTPMIQKCKHPTVISIRSGLVVMGETFNGIVE